MCILATSCQNDKEFQHLLNQCNFIKDKGVIEATNQSEYDIIPEVSMINTNNSFSIQLGVSFKIFNYGGGLRINLYAIENIYSATYVPNNHFYIVDPKDIEITQIHIDDTYGSWAKGDVFIPSFGKYYNDVFISPLTYKFLDSGSVMDDNTIIVLVRLIDYDNNSCFNGLFIGDYIIEYIINNHYPCINNNHLISHGSQNHWPLWKPLMTEEEYDIIRDRHEMLHLLGTYPSNITDIINKYLKR